MNGISPRRITAGAVRPLGKAAIHPRSAKKQNSLAFDQRVLAENLSFERLWSVGTNALTTVESDERDEDLASYVLSHVDHV